MDEIIQVQNQFYILATSSRLAENSRLLKHGDTFVVLDSLGNIQRIGLGELGLYHEGTRFLSRLDFKIQGRRPLLLSSAVTEDNSSLLVDLTNPDFSGDGQVLLPRDTVYISRWSFVFQNVRYERIRLHSFLLTPVEIAFSLEFDTDFADLFEVRGVKREKRGELLEPAVEVGRVRLGYRGLDDVVRTTTIDFQPPPSRLSANRAEFACALPSRGEVNYVVMVTCEPTTTPAKTVPFDDAVKAISRELVDSRAEDASIWTSNEQFNDWLNRSSSDIHLMLTRGEHGPYPYAGIPWFSTYFGRDGIITALEYLWVNPALARGVLGFLAEHQAKETNPLQDAEPGKILHETRQGEMAELGEIPFGKYYGSVDSTPLFVMLAGAYYERTGDRDFLASIWPNIEAALGWIDTFGDSDGDGLIEYMKRSPKGLVVQGWKDSMDSVFHADGALAEGSVALCEVQGYVFGARRAAARLANMLGHGKRSDELYAQAEDLRRTFEEAFWCEEISTYALALDGKKRPCRVRTSNPGHCLYTGIVSPERAVRLGDTLLSEASFSGWGIRTVAATEARYNPMSYHNGSVWPHDNALIAAGLSKYGLMPHAFKVFTGLFDASLFVELHRMPELFCGFARRTGSGPTLYPVACSPQSWAAATAASLLQSLLGLTIDAPLRQIRFTRPVLPESLERLSIRNLKVGDAVVDILVERSGGDAAIELRRRSGDVEIHIVK